MKGELLFGTGNISLQAAFELGFCCLCVIGVGWALSRSAKHQRTRHLQDLHEHSQRAEHESLDKLVQQAQGFILVFQGFAGELSREDPMRKRMEQALDHADGWLKDARELAGPSTTTDSMGDLALALSQASRLLFAGCNIRLSVVTTGRPQVLLQEVADNVFEVGVEALSNAHAHSMATHVEVEIAYEFDRFRLCVRDDGRGLDILLTPRYNRFHLDGLQGMRSTARRLGGSFRIWSRKDAGTEIEIVVPAAIAYGDVRPAPRWFRTILFPRTLC